MNRINIQYYKTKYVEFVLCAFENKLCLLDFKYRKMRTTVDNRLKIGFKAEFVEQDDEILKNSRKQLDEYFNMRRKVFDIPIITVGTDFQKSVWKALIKVPYGTTSTYLQLSKDIDNEKAVRAVANANGANSIVMNK
jgi:methylated-DNA-[protein]-cysteine S-methyltransferase